MASAGEGGGISFYAESYCLIQRNARIWIYIVFQAAEDSCRPLELSRTGNIEGPIGRRNSLQCNLTSGCIHRGGSLLDAVVNIVAAGTKYITEKQKQR